MAETKSADDGSTEAERTEENTETQEETEAPDLTSNPGGFSCIAEQNVLKEYFSPFSTVVEEMKLNINEDGIYGAAVDPANVAMVEEDLDDGAFEHYSSTGGQIGLNINRMEDILSLGTPDDLVHLELDQETRKLHVEIDGLEYTLALIDPDSIRQEPEIPDLDLTAEVVLEGAQLDRGIKAADMVSDHIRLRVDESEEAFYIEAQGDTDDVDLCLEREDLIDLTAGPANSLYSLDYMKDFNKAIAADTELRFEVGEEFPVKINYEHIEVGDERHGNVTMMLAPRIQSD